MSFWFFDCLHKRTTWPQKDRQTQETTVACLDCGRKFDYSFDTMQRGKERAEPIGKLVESR